MRRLPHNFVDCLLCVSFSLAFTPFEQCHTAFCMHTSQMKGTLSRRAKKKKLLKNLIHSNWLFVFPIAKVRICTIFYVNGADKNCAHKHFTHIYTVKRTKEQHKTMKWLCRMAQKKFKQNVKPKWIIYGYKNNWARMQRSRASGDSSFLQMYEKWGEFVCSCLCCAIIRNNYNKTQQRWVCVCVCTSLCGWMVPFNYRTRLSTATVIGVKDSSFGLIWVQDPRTIQIDR